MKKFRPRPPTRRNPMLADLLSNPLYRRAPVVNTVTSRERKRDPWDRDAKHRRRNHF
jgi:hypothetical protein